MKWEDDSHYSHQDRIADKQPTCWKLEIPVLEFKPIVVKVHRMQGSPSTWHLSCTSIVLGPHQLWASDIDDAKKEALQHLHMVIGQMSTSIGEVSMNPEGLSNV